MTKSSPATLTQLPRISGWLCEVCEGRDDYEGLNKIWERDTKITRGVLRDPRLKPANLYREVARNYVAPKKFVGRGSAKVRRQIDEWFTTNIERFPGLELYAGEGPPPIRLSALDLSLLLGYATSFLDHAREVIELGGSARDHLRKHAPAFPRLGKDTEKKLDSTDKVWLRVRKSLARKIVAHDLDIDERTISRRLADDPLFKGPSIWAWAASYHLYSLNPAK